MGLFGFLKLGKKREDAAISSLAAAAAQEEPEFLKGLEVAAEKEVERKLEGGEDGKEPAESVREEVEPELALWLSNGTTVKSLKELAAALKKMKAADYKEHVNEERNDIAEWVQEVLNDEALARQLRAAKGRMQAALYVEKGIRALRAAQLQKGKTPAAKATKIAKLKVAKTAKAAVKGKTVKSEIAEQPMQLTLPGEAESVREEAEIGKEAVEERKPRSWLFFFRKKGRGEKEEAGELGGKSELALEIPEFPELTEEPIEAAKEVKPSRGFLFFGRKGKKEERQEATQETAQKELSELMPELPVAKEMGEEEREKTAAAFEPEPHHAEWAETAEGIKEAMEAEAAESVRKRQEPLMKEQERKESKTYEEAELEKADRELESQEKGLGREEEELNNKRLELTRKRYELIKQKGEIEKKKFEAFMKKHKALAQSEQAMEAMMAEHSTGFRTGFAAPAMAYRGLPDFRLSGAYGKERLQALLEEAKQHISQNNVEEARKTLEEAQSVFGTAYMPLNEKKQMEYEILEVEADLKLASLE